MPFIESLSDGAWLFEELVPPFLAKIAASPRLEFLHGRPLPSYAATLAYYRVLPEADVLSAFALDAFNGRTPSHAVARPVWTRLARTVSEKSSPASLDGPDSAILIKAWDDLASLDAEHGKLFAATVPAMVPLEDSDFGAASSPHLFGCIFVTRKWLELSFERRMLSMVHELAHQELFVLNLVDRLVNSSADYSLVHAPFQGTLRPPIGRLHAAHALFRMRNFQRRLGWASDENENALQETRRTFGAGELTPLAQELVDTVYAS